MAEKTTIFIWSEGGNTGGVPGIVCDSEAELDEILRDREAMQALRKSMVNGHPISVDVCVWNKDRWTKWEAERDNLGGHSIPIHDDPAEAILAVAQPGAPAESKGGKG